MQIYRDAIATLQRENLARLEKHSSHIKTYFDSDGKMLAEAALFRDCNICGSARKQPFLKPTPYIFVECEDCGSR